MTASRGAARWPAPILIALGANLPSPVHGAPARTLVAALASLEAHGIHILARSRLYLSAPVPAADQPWFANAVVRVETTLTPRALLTMLHRIEACFGRQRGARNAPRILDLDLIAHGARVSSAAGRGPILPHPRMGARAFVLLPLADVAPDWHHPVTGDGVRDLIARLPPAQEIRIGRWPARRRPRADGSA